MARTWGVAVRRICSMEEGEATRCALRAPLPHQKRDFIFCTLLMLHLPQR
jgi:hypothetical protein